MMMMMMMIIIIIIMIMIMSMKSLQIFFIHIECWSNMASVTVGPVCSDHEYISH
jgi:hypothetical protein